MAVSHMVTLQSSGNGHVNCVYIIRVMGMAVSHMVTLQGNGNRYVDCGYITG